MAQRKESFFWTSYSDFMTSLFFVMLTLFVLVIVLLHKQAKDYKEEAITKKDQIEEIQKIVKSTEGLDRNYFDYNDKYKKYALNIQVHFDLESDDLMGATAVEDRAALRAAGEKIREFLANHSKTEYIVIIEGQASKDKAESAHNYDLSFRRARSLMEFWINEKIDFGDNCEILISGSGDGTLKTESMKPSMRDNVEKKNQRFLVYVLPKNVFPKGLFDNTSNQ